MRVLALLAAVALTSGCLHASPDYHVRIDVYEKGKKRDGLGFGHGILVDARHVVTVNHVAPGAKYTYHVSRAYLHGYHLSKIRYIKATFVGSFGQDRSVETLSVLRLSKPMHCEIFPEFRMVEEGDSGSPILGKRGEVIGLVTGRIGPFVFIGQVRHGNSIIGTNGPVGPVPFRKEED